MYLYYTGLFLILVVYLNWQWELPKGWTSQKERSAGTTKIGGIDRQLHHHLQQRLPQTLAWAAGHARCAGSTKLGGTASTAGTADSSIRYLGPWPADNEQSHFWSLFCKSYDIEHSWWCKERSICFLSLISFFGVQVPAYLVNLLTHLMWDVAGLESSLPLRSWWQSSWRDRSASSLTKNMHTELCALPIGLPRPWRQGKHTRWVQRRPAGSFCLRGLASDKSLSGRWPSIWQAYWTLATPSCCGQQPFFRPLLKLLWPGVTNFKRTMQRPKYYKLGQKYTKLCKDPCKEMIHRQQHLFWLRNQQNQCVMQPMTD